jgi:hexosaminidase
MKQIFTILSLALVLLSCSKEVTRTDIGIIPQPASVEIYEGTFNAAGAAFEADALCETVLNAISTFENNLVAASGAASGTSGSKFVFKADQSLGEEEYTIEVSAKKAVVKASGLNGFVYALESIKQLLPAEIYTGAPSAATCWCLPCLKIQDEPRFGYRGMHLDVSRHFFDANEVKKYIDIMAIHKLNVLHWHLTDDQGWRLEIKKYPQLTEHGAIRKQTIIGHGRDRKGYDNTPYGEGFYYTQDQVKEIIDYAAAKGIEIIPEIDLPGHMLAALACFPELGCTGGPYDVWGRWGIADDVLCVGKEETMKFLEDVLAEVADLFPSEYVHIGGDECPKVRWETCPHCQAKIAELGLKDDDKHKAEHYLQSYVTNRMEQFLSTKGKKIIGWDEILEGEIAPNATVMSWRGVEGGLEAVRMGHDAIMVPYTHLYLDYYQSKDKENEPLAIGGYVPVELVYSFEPFTEDMTDEEKSHILGIQANLWTEYIPTDAQLEYMLLPRLSALSEIQWCEPENKDYERFLGNMESMRKIYDILGYNYAKHIFTK